MTTAYDIKITGGTIIDGTGSPGFRGDVGIRDGKVAALGSVEGSAKQTIEADDCVVSPGFVDIHTHYDAQIIWDRMLTISPWHGVTTAVMGNCGFGVAPTRPEHRNLILQTLEKVEGMSVRVLQAGLGSDWPFESFPEYLQALENIGPLINVGAMIGHTPLRLYVMGEAATERKATDEEIAQMRALVLEAVRAGAIGFATSKSGTHVGYKGRPVPSRLAEFDEIRSLFSALGEAEQGVMQATIGRDLMLPEFETLARETKRNISWTALLAGARGPGSHLPLLEAALKQQEDGLPIYPQVSCRPLNFDFNMEEPFLFENLPYFKPISKADLEGKKKIYSDPSFRAQFKQSVEKPSFRARLESTVISFSPAEPALTDRSLVETARARGKDPSDLILDLSMKSNLKIRFRMSIMNADEVEVGKLLQSPMGVLGLSDAGAHASQLCDACYSTHLLGHWVREKGVLGLEKAVRMLTSRPAEVFEIADRGRLAEDLPADVVVFDPRTVGAGKLERVHDLPSGADRLISRAKGIEAVIVNGTLISQHGKDVLDPEGSLPGQVVRSGQTG